MTGAIRLVMFTASTATFVLFTGAVIDYGLHGHAWMVVLYALLLGLVPGWLGLEAVWRRWRTGRR